MFSFSHDSRIQPLLFVLTIKRRNHVLVLVHRMWEDVAKWLPLSSFEFCPQIFKKWSQLGTNKTQQYLEVEVDLPHHPPKKNLYHNFLLIFSTYIYTHICIYVYITHYKKKKNHLWMKNICPLKYSGLLCNM